MICLQMYIFLLLLLCMQIKNLHFYVKNFDFLSKNEDFFELLYKYQLQLPNNFTHN
jgi:hypothetical protein